MTQFGPHLGSGELFGSTPTAIHQANTLITATAAHITAICGIQADCSLAAKIASGQSERDIERSGFLVHLMDSDGFAGMVADPGVISRVHIGKTGAVDAYGFAYPLDIWKARNPDWQGMITPSPNDIRTEDQDTMLIRYTATARAAAAGTGAKMLNGLTEIAANSGFKSAVAETALAPRYNRPIDVVLGRLGFNNAGRIHERYQETDYTWKFHRKPL